MVGVGVVGGGEQDARVDNEHASVSAEAVGEELVGVTRTTPGGGRAQPDERERPLRRRGLGGERFCQLGDHRVDADATSLGLGLQAGERILGKVDGDGHEGTASWDEGAAANESSPVNPSVWSLVPVLVFAQCSPSRVGYSAGEGEAADSDPPLLEHDNAAFFEIVYDRGEVGEQQRRLLLGSSFGAAA